MTDMKELVQVECDHYQLSEYDTKERFASYWYQINLILSRKPGSVLEVGVGNKFINSYLKGRGIDITSLDIDPRLNPDFVGSVLHLPFKENSFDLVVCYQVLEHLPFESFQNALRQLAFISRGDVLISLPDVEPNIHIRIRSIRREYLQKYIIFPRRKKPLAVSDVGHYWEVGREGYPLNRILKAIVDSRLKIEHTFRLMDNMYHRFFILKKVSEQHEYRHVNILANKDPIRIGNCENWRSLPKEDVFNLTWVGERMLRILGVHKRNTE